MQLILHASPEERGEVYRRLAYFGQFLPPVRVIERDRFPYSRFFSADAILYFGNRSWLDEQLIKWRPGTFDVDYTRNPLDGWAWTDLVSFADAGSVDFASSRQRLATKIQALKSLNKGRCYVFGTGPSLARALDYAWQDGYRVVCNTIVRDPILWEHIAPDFIVAGDAIHHFGFTGFARAFRRDLRMRLESSDTLFVYPAQFHSIVQQELSAVAERLVPIPSGWQRRVDIDLIRSFRLPALGNVLPLLLLPLACTLSKEIYLWGFDGRAPDDRYFWSNSSQHSYPEHLDELRQAHPRFFSYHVPESDPDRYVRNVQGDQLDICLSLAEKRGWRFVMMHPSWTPTLQKRYRPECNPARMGNENPLCA